MFVSILVQELMGTRSSWVVLWIFLGWNSILRRWKPVYQIEKAIKGVARLLEKRSSTIHKELQSLVGLLLLLLRLFIQAEHFSDVFITHQLRAENICTGLNLLRMICYDGKNFYLDDFYASIVNVFHFGQLCPDFVAQKDIFYLAIALSEFCENVPICNKQNLFFKRSNKLQFI